MNAREELKKNNENTIKMEHIVRMVAENFTDTLFERNNCTSFTGNKQVWTDSFCGWNGNE